MTKLIQPKNKATIRALIESAQHWDRNCVKFEGDGSFGCSLCQRFSGESCCTKFETCPMKQNGQQCGLTRGLLWANEVSARENKQAVRPHCKALADFLWSLVPDAYQHERVKP